MSAELTIPSRKAGIKAPLIMEQASEHSARITWATESGVTPRVGSSFKSAADTSAEGKIAFTWMPCFLYSAAMLSVRRATTLFEAL